MMIMCFKGFIRDVPKIEHKEFWKELLVTRSEEQLSDLDSLINADLWFGRHCQTCILYLRFLSQLFQSLVNFDMLCLDHFMHQIRQFDQDFLQYHIITV